jgi:DNA-binding GntR family transcriptional regulator
MASLRHQTKTDIALAVLRERIASGDLQPGQRLRVEELAEELGMSPTPIREALRVLQADGMLQYKPHHAVVVADVSTAEIDEIYLLRSVLEPLATELAAPRLTSAGLAQLTRLQTEYERAYDGGNERSMTKLNASWHWAIYDAADSKLLGMFIRRLWDSFPWRTIGSLPGRADSIVIEHRAILSALIERDGTAAASHMRQHITESGNHFRALYAPGGRVTEPPEATPSPVA